MAKEPYETVVKSYQDEKVYFLSDLPVSGYPYADLTKTGTVYKSDVRMLKEGGTWKWFKLDPNQQIATETYGFDKATRKRKIYPALLDGTYHKQMSIPAQLIKDRKLSEEDFQMMERVLRENKIKETDIQAAMQEARQVAPYVKIYKVKWLGWCGNAVPIKRHFYVVEFPAILTITEKYGYAGWVIPAAILAGLLIGLGLGYLFWFGSAATKVVTVAKGAPCAGGPVPR